MISSRDLGPQAILGAINASVSQILMPGQLTKAPEVSHWNLQSDELYLMLLHILVIS